MPTTGVLNTNGQEKRTNDRIIFRTRRGRRCSIIIDVRAYACINTNNGDRRASQQVSKGWRTTRRSAHRLGGYAYGDIHRIFAAFHAFPYRTNVRWGTVRVLGDEQMRKDLFLAATAFALVSGTALSHEGAHTGSCQQEWTQYGIFMELFGTGGRPGVIEDAKRKIAECTAHVIREHAWCAERNSGNGLSSLVCFGDVHRSDQKTLPMDTKEKK